MPDAERTRQLRVRYPDLPAASEADLDLLDALDQLVERLPAPSVSPAGFQQLLAGAATHPRIQRTRATWDDGHELAARSSGAGGVPHTRRAAGRGWLRQLRQGLAFAGGALAFALVAALLIALFRDGAPGNRANAPGNASPVSDDGATLLYVAPNGGDSWGSTLWALDPASGATHALYVNSDGPLLAPAVAPDGSRVAFSTGRELLVLALDGTGVVIAVRDDSESGLRQPVWSPDSREIAYEISQWDGSRTLAVAAADGSGTRTLPGSAGGQWPRWSPDGATLLFVADTALRLIDRDGDNSRTLVEQATSAAAAWFPDGARVVYARDIERDGDLVVVDVATGEQRQLTSGPEYDANPHPSPDGGAIAFDRHAANGAVGSVWLIDAVGGEPRQIGATHAAVENAFVSDSVLGWTPDGQQIRFILLTNPSIGPPEIGLLGQLGLIDGDGSNRRLLTDTLRFGWDSPPQWLPRALDALPDAPVVAPTITPYPGATPRPGQPVTPTPELGAIETRALTSARPLQPGEERTFVFDLRADVRADAGTLLAWNVKGNERMLPSGSMQRYLIARPLDYVNSADGAVFAELVSDGARWRWTVRGWGESGTGEPDPRALPQELALPLLVLRYASQVYPVAGTGMTLAPPTEELPTGYPFEIVAPGFQLDATEPAGGSITAARLIAWDDDDRQHLLAEATIVDLALLPLDDATDAFVVPEPPAEPPLQAAAPADDVLPAGLQLEAHERVAGAAAEHLRLRAESGVEVTVIVSASIGGVDRGLLDRLAPPGSGTTVHTSETALGPLGWLAPSDAASRAPQLAIWDDGQRHFRLEVVAIPMPDAWTEADLIALVEALSGWR